MAKHLFSIKFINFVTDLQKYGSVAQLNRASDSGSAGHGFESHPSHLQQIANITLYDPKTVVYMLILAVFF